MSTSALDSSVSYKEFICKAGQLVVSTDDSFAAIAVDISNFKYLNDIYGMDEADEAVDYMVEHLFKDNPRCPIFYRTVGDQFRALINTTGRTIEEEINIIIEYNTRIENYFAEKYPKVYLHIYTGVYFIDRNNFDMRIAIDKAHFAKKQLKGNFRDKCKMYTEEEFEDFSRQMDMVREFEKACNSDRIIAFFQPKIDSKTGRLIGAEALCRIIKEDGTYISPGLFIPILEKNGMLSKLDAIMMEKTFTHIREWIDKGYPVVPVSINLSRINFYNNNLVNQIIALRDKYNIPAEYVELEVTESAFIEDMEIVSRTVNSLRENGFKIDVDDFGSGYSALGMLISIPADIIKLDSSFARNNLNNSRGISIVGSVIEMLHKVNYDVICEGIETKEEENLINSLGCNKIQGFLYDKPLPKNEFEKKYFN